MDPLSLTVSITTLIGATTQVLSYLNDVKTAPKERAKLASEATNLLALLTNLRYKAEEVERERNQWYESIRYLLGGANGPLGQFRSALEELTGKLAPATGLKKLSRTLTWTLDKKECIDILDKIERLKTLIGLALQEDQLKLAQAIKADTASIPAMGSSVTEIEKGVEGLQLGEDVKLRRNIVEWLSPLNFFVTQDDIFSRRREGTGQWLLESPEFTDWLSGSKKVLWCPGIPGAGKTILASTVVNRLHEQFKDDAKFGVACIYCNYKENDVQTPASLLASLWMQLAEHHGSLSADVVDLYKKCVNRGTRPPLSEISRILQSEISKYSNVFVVLDALDECSERDGTRQLFLAELRRLTPNISLLVTSRDITNIEQEFQNAVRLEIRANDEDVRSYLKSRIEGQPQLVRYIQKDVTLQDTILDTIAQKANGMFLLAQLHMDSLAREDNRKAVRRALENLPEELNETYDNAMRRILSQNRQQVRRAEQVLSWISYAVRPLAIKEIQCALAVELEDTELDEVALPDEDLLVSVCAGLVTIDRESKTIRLVHYTTQEYFQRIRGNQFPKAQVEIARTCLTCLLFDTFAEGACSSDQLMEARLQVNPLLRYAALHWGDHARGGPEQIIKDLILKFLDKKSNLSCAMQVMRFPSHRFTGYSQHYTKNFTSLHVAAYHGLEKITKMLLELGGGVVVQDEHQRAVLHWAVDGGHEAVVKLLLEKGADIAAQSNIGWTVLHTAVDSGNEAIVKLLLEKGADIAAQSNSGWTVLRTAVRSGNEAIVKLLLEKRADVAAQDIDGWTVLHIAVSNGNEAIVKLLLEKGADIAAQSNIGWTALHIAVSNGNEAIVKLLLEKGADIAAQSNIGWTVLRTAVRSGNEAIVKLMLEKGADIAAEDKSGWTALHEAARYGCVEVVELLIENGADVTAKDQSGWTALHIVAESGPEGVVKLLLEKGADIAAQDNSKFTALHIAVQSGNEPVVKLLIENGADIAAQEKNELTALQLAIKEKQKAVV